MSDENGKDWSDNPMAWWNAGKAGVRGRSHEEMKKMPPEVRAFMKKRMDKDVINSHNWKYVDYDDIPHIRKRVFKFECTNCGCVGTHTVPTYNGSCGMSSPPEFPNRVKDALNCEEGGIRDIIL